MNPWRGMRSWKILSVGLVLETCLQGKLTTTERLSNINIFKLSVHLQAGYGSNGKGRTRRSISGAFAVFLQSNRYIREYSRYTSKNAASINSSFHLSFRSGSIFTVEHRCRVNCRKIWSLFEFENTKPTVVTFNGFKICKFYPALQRDRVDLFK